MQLILAFKHERLNGATAKGKTERLAREGRAVSITLSHQLELSKLELQVVETKTASAFSAAG